MAGKPGAKLRANAFRHSRCFKLCFLKKYRMTSSANVLLTANRGSLKLFLSGLANAASKSQTGKTKPKVASYIPKGIHAMASVVGRPNPKKYDQ